MAAELHALVTDFYKDLLLEDVVFGNWNNTSFTYEELPNENKFMLVTDVKVPGNPLAWTVFTRNPGIPSEIQYVILSLGHGIAPWGLLLLI